MATDDHTPQRMTLILSSLNPDAKLEYPCRHIQLDRNSRSVVIGRTSKRKEEMAAKTDNGLFDSPVMSRNHAVFDADFDKQVLYVADIGSTHGTFVNGDRLPKNTPYTILGGEHIQFGVEIVQKMEHFPPHTVNVDFAFVDPIPSSTIPAANTGLAPVDASSVPCSATIFQVPDSSDDEESDRDFDESLDVQRSRHGIGNRTPPHVDLTNDGDEEELNQPNPWAGKDCVVIGTTNQLPTIPSDDTTIRVSTAGTNKETRVLSIPVISDQDWPSDVESVSDDEPSSPLEEMSPSISNASIRLSESIDDSESDNEEGTESERWDDEEEEEEDEEDEEHSDLEIESAYDEPFLYDDADLSDPDDEDFVVDSDPPPRQQPQPGSIPYLINAPTIPPPHPLPSLNTISGLEPRLAITKPEFYAAREENKARISAVTTAGDASTKASLSKQTPADIIMTNDVRLPPLAPHHLPLPLTRPNAMMWPVDAPRSVRPNNQAGNDEAGLFANQAISEFQASVLAAATVAASSLAAAHPDKPMLAARESHITKPSPEPVVILKEPPLPPIETAISSSKEVMDAGNSSQGPEQGTASKVATSRPRAAEPVTVAETPWTASGDKFLNSPIAGLPNSHEHRPDELDMTSAYQFELSKKARSVSGRVDIKDILIPQQDPKSHSPLKRKADEMSLLTPEEEKFEMAGPTLQSTEAPATSQVGVEKNDDATNMEIAAPSTLASPATTEARAPKRLRRVTEALTYVALGGAATGVALFTALVATAPSLT